MKKYSIQYLSKKNENCYIDDCLFDDMKLFTQVLDSLSVEYKVFKLIECKKRESVRRNK